ncbi:MAG: hypothetical protein U0790_01690 [Isosphaeraceae bacterium]
MKQTDDLARAGRRIEQPSRHCSSQFSRLLGRDPQAVRSFSALQPAESAWWSSSARPPGGSPSYPEQAETMVRQLGPEGLTAMRVYGDDVAEVLVKEGPRPQRAPQDRQGRLELLHPQVLPHKKKLAAAVLAAFLADPDRFVDYAGQATEFAVREFARAGISLAAAAGGGVAQGLESSIGEALASRGLNQPFFRYLGMGWRAWSSAPSSSSWGFRSARCSSPSSGRFGCLSASGGRYNSSVDPSPEDRRLTSSVCKSCSHAATNGVDLD